MDSANGLTQRKSYSTEGNGKEKEANEHHNHEQDSHTHSHSMFGAHSHSHGEHGHDASAEEVIKALQGSGAFLFISYICTTELHK